MLWYAVYYHLLHVYPGLQHTHTACMCHLIYAFTQASWQGHGTSLYVPIGSGTLQMLPKIWFAKASTRKVWQVTNFMAFCASGVMRGSSDHKLVQVPFAQRLYAHMQLQWLKYQNFSMGLLIKCFVSLHAMRCLTTHAAKAITGLSKALRWLP